jgi:spore maturation protein CgeB
MLDDGHDILGEAALLVPGATLRTYDPATLDLDEVLHQADIVIAHEWNDSALIEALGVKRRNGGAFLLLFHDTHHRAVTASHQIGEFNLEDYDGVLAFGEVLRQVYQQLGWGRRVFTWHEAADVFLFRPMPREAKEVDLIWIGNWGDGERDRELQEFLVEPIVDTGLTARIYGVRYPEQIRQRLQSAGIDFRGWLPNHRAPDAFAHARLTMHVPRRPYVEALPGIPTIRIFEALACAIPLISAPWDDAEGLFPPDTFVKVKSGEAAAGAMRKLLWDGDFAAETAHNGLKTIHARHTCAHRVQELLAIVRELGTNGNSSRTGLSHAPEQMVAS